MSQWYLSQDGRAAGPYDTEKIIAKIQSGELNQLDLIFQVGAKEWLSLSQVPEFSSYLQKQKAPAQGAGQSQDWVLLKKVVGEEGSQFEQLGPFSQKEVMQLIEAGDVKFTDFAWKSGMENWQRIGELDVFSEPLPSTPSIDASLYESTKTDVDRAPLSEMVRIEHYRAEPDTLKADEDRLEVSVTQEAPINSEDFVTDSELTQTTETATTGGEQELSTVDEVSTADEGTSFWSLEPPSEEKTVVKSQVKKAPKKAPESRKRRVASQRSPLRLQDFVSKERLQMASALFALGLAFLFFYMSFRGDKVNEVSGAQENVQGLQEGSTYQGQEPSRPPAPYEPQDLRDRENKINQLVAEMKSARTGEAESRGETLKRSQQKKKAVKKEKANSVSKKDRAKELPRPFKKRASGHNGPHVASQKRKKLPIAPEKNRSALAQAKSPARQKKLRSRPASAVPSPVQGSAKQQSFFKQRDRKALFYSSMRAEALAIEIETQYRKLKANKGAWTRYYSQWKQKVDKALSADLKKYPAPSETYAYPRLLAAFKKDYALFYDYGESFNKKVQGARQVASPPKNMKAVFAKYRNKARNLGQ